MMKRRLPEFALILLLAGCFSDNNDGSDVLNGRVVSDVELIAQVMDAPQSITIDGIALTANAFVWRDFQPIIGGGRNGIMSANTLMSTNERNISGRFSLLQQWVVHNSEVWIPNYENEERPRNNEMRINKISRNGPLWQPGAEVQVGFRILDVQTGNRFILSVNDLTIERTD